MLHAPLAFHDFPDLVLAGFLVLVFGLLHRDGELYVLARSLPRRGKECAMRRKKLKAYWTRLKELQKRDKLTSSCSTNSSSACPPSPRPKSETQSLWWRPFEKMNANSTSRIRKTL